MILTINEKLKRAKEIIEMTKNFLSSNIDEMDSIRKDIQVAVEANNKSLTNEELVDIRDAALALYDGEVWARLGVNLWHLSRNTSNLIVQRATNTPSLNIKMKDANLVMKETKSVSVKEPKVPNIAELSEADKQKLIQFLRTGKK